MPKSFTTNTLAFSIRLHPALARWIEEQARNVGSFNQVIRDIIDDARTLYRLPEVMTDQLDAEAAALGKSRRDYVAHLLSLRAAQLMKGEISLPGKGSKPPKR
jgi:hypothetical protein